MYTMLSYERTEIYYMQISQDELLCHFIQKSKEDEQFKYECYIKEAELNVARNLKQYRIALNLSQEDVAQKSGLTRQMVSRVETFSYTPNLTTLIKYLWALNVDFMEITKHLSDFRLQQKQ